MVLFEEADKTGWAEVRACLDDDNLGSAVRAILRAYQRSDRATVRMEAERLLAGLPDNLWAARDLLRRLRDVGL